MDVIDFELKRFDQWKDTIDGKGKAVNTPDKVNLINLTSPHTEIKCISNKCKKIVYLFF